MPTKFGDDWFNSEEMAIVSRNSSWRQQLSWIPISMRFRHDICVLCQIRNIPTKFGEDWFHSKNMVAFIRNPRLRRQPT